MSNGIDFVLYLGPVGNGPSDQCRRLHAQLAEQSRARVKIMDYAEITRALGAKKPAWLRGFPTLVSYESPPRVLEGTAVISTLTEWVQRQQQAQPQQQAQQQPQPQRQQMQPSGVGFHRGTPQAPAAPVAISQSSDGDFNKASVVSDDLYVSRMESRHGGAEQGSMRGSRVTSSDIEAFNRARVSRQ